MEVPEHWNETGGDYLSVSLWNLITMNNQNDHTEEQVFRNIARVLNQTQVEEHSMKLRERYLSNLYVDGKAFYLLLCVYGLLIAIGTVGNSFVVCAVIRKSSMRTARNMFIINLAISDLILCVITMPLTLMQIVTTYWPLGNHEILCKTVNSLQAVSIFVSTISITAIALDRYHVIVYPTKRSVQHVGAVAAVMGIWALACVPASPLIVWYKLKHFNVNLTEVEEIAVDFCYEDWPVEHGRAYYSLFSMIIQYVLPITIVSVAYFQICKKLRYRMKPGGRAAENPAGGRRGGSVRKDQARVRRTNLLLISIALIFGISWIPLNAFNLIVDFWDPFNGDRYTEKVLFGICHVMGMSSANSNPVLYGFFNDNFRKEFRDIWLSLKSFYCCCCCFFRRRDDITGRSNRDSRADREQTATVHYRKSTKASPVDGDVEPSTLITQVLDRDRQK